MGRVSQHQPRLPAPLAVPGQRLDEHAGPPDLLGEFDVGCAHAGERDQQVQPGGDALDPGPGQMLAHGGQQGVTTAALPLAASAGVLLGGPAPQPPVWAGIAVVAVGLALGLRSRITKGP